MTKEIKLQFLTDEGLAQLKQMFDTNYEQYKNKNHQYFLDYLHSNNYLQDSVYTVRDFTRELQYSYNENEDDFNNIKVVYSALKDIPTYIMMDDRFWAALTHTIMWDYVTKRSLGYKKGIKNDKKKIYNSFFTHTANGKKRGTYVNCVSRLWWAGKLTYDSECENHFELTNELCKKGFASTIITFSSSNIIGREETRKALLTVIRDLRQNNIDVKRDDITHAIQYMNLIGGSTMIDTISFSELVEILKKYYFDYYHIVEA